MHSCFGLSFLTHNDYYTESIYSFDLCLTILYFSFPAVPQYFNPVSAGPLLNQLDSPDLAWRTKNLLWDELNVLKRKLNVKTKQGIDDYRLKTSMVGQNVCLWTSGRSPQVKGLRGLPTKRDD